MIRGELLQQLEEKIRNEKNNTIRYILLQELADVYIEEGNLENAFRYYKQALDVAQRMGNRPFECDTLIDLGSTAEQLGWIDDAISFYEDALKIAQDVHNFRVQNRILGMLGKLAAKAGNRKLAIDYFERAINMVPVAEAKAVQREEKQEAKQISAGLDERDFRLSPMIQLSTQVSDEIKQTERLRKMQPWIVLISGILLFIALIGSSKYLPTLVTVILALVIFVGTILMLNDTLSIFSEKDQEE